MVQKQLFHRLGVAFTSEVSASKGKRARKERAYEAEEWDLVCFRRVKILSWDIYLPGGSPILPWQLLIQEERVMHTSADIHKVVCPPTTTVPPTSVIRECHGNLNVHASQWPVWRRIELTPWMLRHALLISWHFSNSSDRTPWEGLLFPHPKHPSQVKALTCM